MADSIGWIGLALIAAAGAAGVEKVGLPSTSPMIRLGAIVLRADPELVLLGRRCMPTRLMNDGFEFKFNSLDAAFADLIKP